MESNLQSGNMNPSGGPTFGTLDLQGSMGVNHHPHPHNLHQQQQQPQQPQQHHHHHSQPNPMSDYNPSSERGKNLPSDDDDHNFNEEMDGQGELSNGGNKSSSSLWRRVKWTDSMIKLLITALSYVGDDDACHRGRRKFFNIQKKGKWKSISKVMAERGFYVSPQQCEDKFNDLNKRYKKLNDILGRGTSCEVVENPALLDMMDHLPEKAKDEVKKILSSKHLFYEEMCSYHNGNRLHLPHDPALQRSLQLALRSKDDHDDDDGDDHDDDGDDHEEYDGGRAGGGCGLLGESAKRMKQGQGGSLEDFSFGNLQPTNFDFNLSFSEGQKGAGLQEQNQSWKLRSLQLEEQKLQIHLETLDLEKQQLKWQRFSKKKDRELEKLRMENEKMRLENERMAIKLKQMEFAMKNNHQ